MNPKFDEFIGKKIKEVRKQRRLTQIDIANILGLHQAGVSRIESGDQSITLREILKLSKAFDVPLNDFIEGAKL